MNHSHFMIMFLWMKIFSVHDYRILGSLVQNNSEESDDDTGDPLLTVTYQQAYSAFSGEYQLTYHLLNELETEIQRCGDNNRVQSLITDFLPFCFNT